MSDAPAPDGVELLARAAEAGIHRLKLPTPYAVGPVNCWLIDDEPLTLIDTGPNSGSSLDQLALALGALGRNIEQLEMIVITHQHLDHLGLLDILARRSGAEVAAIAQLVPWLERFPDSAGEDDRYAQVVMRRHGVPDDVVTALGLVAEAFRPYGSPGRVTRPLRDGDQLRLRDRTLQVQHRPGHSPTDTLFFDPERGIMFGGDHLLAHISSNPVISRPLERDPTGPRAHSLLDYIESLRRTRELAPALVLGGHGDPIADAAALIDARMRMHDRRARKILNVIAGGPISAYEIALRMWGNVSVTQAFLTLSEVLGHVDLLIADGTVRELGDGELVRFEASGRRAT